MAMELSMPQMNKLNQGLEIRDIMVMRGRIYCLCENNKNVKKTTKLMI